jgi:hypothetical protein
VLTVTSTADTDQDGFLTVREAIAQANNDAFGGQSDTIVFDDSLGRATITLTGGPLTLSGANPDVAETMDGSGRITLSGNNSSQVLIINSGVHASITGLTITAGQGYFGGGVDNQGTLTVSNSALSNNTAIFGGPPAAGGGAINNRAGATLMVTASIFSSNNGPVQPGGLGGALDNHGTAMIIDTMFNGNVARAAGGIENLGTLTVNGSTFTSNRTGALLAPGGTISNESSGVLTLTNSTLYANIGGAGGGLANYGNATLTSVTVTGNRTLNPGVAGGLYLYSGTVLLDNSIVAGNVNTDPSGTHPSDILLAPSATVDPASSYNVIGTGGSGGLMDGENGNQVGVANAGLGPLAENGGSTQTLALLAGSPALNAGDPAQAGAPDQRRVLRTGGVNVGAYQASASGFVVTAPDTSMAGMPFDVALTAVDPFGQVALGYTGTVAFSTQDPAGTFDPAGYSFQPGDYGTATFPQGATLNTPDNTWDVTATDVDSGITGAAYVAVTEAPAPPAGVGARRDRAAAPADVGPDAPAVARWFAARAPEGPTALAWEATVEAMARTRRHASPGLVDGTAEGLPAVSALG